MDNHTQAGIRRIILALFANSDLWANNEIGLKKIHEACCLMSNTGYAESEVRHVLASLVREKKFYSRVKNGMRRWGVNFEKA